MGDDELLGQIAEAGARLREARSDTDRAHRVLVQLLTRGRKRYSLRTLAKAAGLSNVRVLQLTRKEGS